MKIYQIHEHSGEYEDYRDRIVGSYLNEEKARARKEEFEHIEDERQIKARCCSSCPINDYDTDVDAFDVAVQECSMYCPHAKIIEDNVFGGYDCENYCNHWDEVTYEIEEVEVIE